MNKSEHHRAAVAAALTTPAPKAAPANVVADSFQQLMRLNVFEIQFSDVNPRQQRNSQYNMLKDSIRSGGFHGSLSVTKVNGNYQLIFGGNTRLEILQELAREDSRFKTVPVHFTPSEDNPFKRMAMNFSENSYRADISFWDKANAIVTMFDLANREAERKVSVADFILKAKSDGIANLSSSYISYCQFAVKHCQQWPHKDCSLTLSAVKTISAVRSLMQKINLPETILGCFLAESRGVELTSLNNAITAAIGIGARKALEANSDATDSEVADFVVKKVGENAFLSLEQHIYPSKKKQVKQWLIKNLSQNGEKKARISPGEKKSAAARKPAFSTAVENDSRGSADIGALAAAAKKHGISVAASGEGFFVSPQKLDPSAAESVYNLWWLLAAASAQFSQPPSENSAREHVTFHEKISDDEEEASLLEYLGGKPIWFSSIDNNGVREILSCL